IARPIAVPTMPDSASGVSMTRSSPKSFCRPSVTRNTPPSLPTSSPMMRTFGSASIALRRPSFSALPNVIVGMSVARIREGGKVRRHLLPLLVEQRRALGINVVEQRQRVRIRQSEAPGAQVCRQLVGGGVNTGEELGVTSAAARQVRLHPLDRVLQLPGLELGGEPVPSRI